MNFNSPKYTNPHYRRSDEFKSPYTSPQNNSPGFSPYGSSSPTKHHRGPMRYFNNSNASTNSSGSNGSPYKQQHNRKTRDYFNKKGRGSTESPNISAYYDPSAMENPWAELEREYEERKEREKESIKK